MKFYCIPPNKHLELMDRGDRYFCLAHHYKNNPDYKNYFLNLKKIKPISWITLDNGAAEHSSVTEDDLIEIVRELKPSEVIPPDVLFDKEETLKNFHSFVSKMKKFDLLHTSIFACPQGTTKETWIECFYQMLVSPFVKCIGLSKIAIPKCWNNATEDKMIAESRNECINELLKRKLLLKPVHLLGMGEHTEFDFYLKNKIQNIRSSDSCYTVLAAINGIDFESGNLTRIPTTNEYFDKTLTDSQKELAEKNISFLKRKYSEV